MRETIKKIELILVIGQGNKGKLLNIDVPTYDNIQEFNASLNALCEKRELLFDGDNNTEIAYFEERAFAAFQKWSSLVLTPADLQVGYDVFPNEKLRRLLTTYLAKNSTLFLTKVENKQVRLATLVKQIFGSADELSAKKETEEYQHFLKNELIRNRTELAELLETFDRDVEAVLPFQDLLLSYIEYITTIMKKSPKKIATDNLVKKIFFLVRFIHLEKEKTPDDAFKNTAANLLTIINSDIAFLLKSPILSEEEKTVLLTSSDAPQKIKSQINTMKKLYDLFNFPIEVLTEMHREKIWDFLKTNIVELIIENRPIASINPPYYVVFTTKQCLEILITVYVESHLKKTDYSRKLNHFISESGIERLPCIAVLLASSKIAYERIALLKVLLVFLQDAENNYPHEEKADFLLIAHAEAKKTLPKGFETSETISIENKASFYETLLITKLNEARYERQSTHKTAQEKILLMLQKKSYELLFEKTIYEIRTEMKIISRSTLGLLFGSHDENVHHKIAAIDTMLSFLTKKIRTLKHDSLTQPASVVNHELVFNDDDEKAAASNGNLGHIHNTILTILKRASLAEPLIMEKGDCDHGDNPEEMRII